jgi:hypothetical protein
MKEFEPGGGKKLRQKRRAQGKKTQGEKEVFLKVISSTTIGKNYILCTSRRRRRQKTVNTAAENERWEMRPERCTRGKRRPGRP